MTGSEWIHADELNVVGKNLNTTMKDT